MSGSSSRPEDAVATRVVAAPTAPLGGGDATRRWAVSGPDERLRFPGLTRPEAEVAAGWLPARGAGGWDRALVEIALPVLLSDGAGPYLVDAEGRLVLALAEHPRVPGARLAMGPPAADRALGLVRRCADGGWRWSVRVEVGPDEHVAALDALAAAGDEEAAAAWAAGVR